MIVSSAQVAAGLPYINSRCAAAGAQLKDERQASNI